MIERRPLESLDATSVAAAQAEITALLRASFPNIDFRRGLFHDRVVLLSAMLAASDQQLIDDLGKAQSLLDLEADPDLADDDLVDAVLSNFRVARRAGSIASGPITIVVAKSQPFTLAAGSEFASGGVLIRTSQATAVRTSPAQVTSPTDRVLVAQPDGNYAFTIPAAAVEAGASGQLRRGAAVVPSQPPPNFSSAYVQSDWSGGADVETNAQLVARFQAGIAAPTFSNRVTTAAMIAAQPRFAGVLNTSFIGGGDAELGRARHSIFPIALPGYCDLYVRSAALPLRTALEKTAVLAAVEPDGGVWQFSMARDDAPGFYEIVQITASGSDPSLTGYGVTSDVRGYDTTGLDYVPDVTSAFEAAYSAYQTAVIRFKDTDRPTAGLVVGQSTAAYTVAASRQPLIKELQDFIGGRKVAWPAGDVLVKGVVPCTLRVAFTVYSPPGAPAVDATAIAQALAAAVNGAGFAGKLYASALIEAIADEIPPGSALGPIDMFGRIRRPDGSIAYIRDPAILSIPDEPDLGVTPRTTVFILDPADVSVAEAPTALPEV